MRKWEDLKKIFYEHILLRIIEKAMDMDKIFSYFHFIQIFIIIQGLLTYHSSLVHIKQLFY